MPTVSVLMSTYNGARHLRPAIDSVLAQEGVDFELVIVDNLSGDETVAIAESYRDTRLRIVRQPDNLGVEGNWNRCMALADGTYVKMMPQDDTLMPNALAEQAKALDRDPGIALAFGARDIINDGGRRLARRGMSGRSTGRIPAKELMQKCIRAGTNLLGEPAAVLFRKDLADRIGPWNAAQPFMLDLDYWFRLLQQGDAWYIDRPVATFRVAAVSWSVSIGSDQSRQYSDFLDRMQAAGLIAPSPFDLLSGRIKASMNKLARMLFYKLVVR